MVESETEVEDNGVLLEVVRKSTRQMQKSHQPQMREVAWWIEDGSGQARFPHGVAHIIRMAMAGMETAARWDGRKAELARWRCMNLTQVEQKGGGGVKEVRDSSIVDPGLK
jgi:hypothetical protein